MYGSKEQQPQPRLRDRPWKVSSRKRHLNQDWKNEQIFLKSQVKCFRQEEQHMPYKLKSGTQVFLKFFVIRTLNTRSVCVCVLSYVQLFATPWTSNPPGFSAASSQSLQSYLTLCNPTDSSPLGSFIPGILHARILEWVAISFSVHGILQARILEWVAIPFPSRSSQPRD